MTRRMIEGILCKGWNNFLSKDGYDDFCSFLNKVFKDKKIEFDIEKKLFGRTKKIEVIIIRINNYNYILPKEGFIKKEIETICNEDYKYIFYLNGKYLPRGIPQGEIDSLYLNYKKTLNFDYYYRLLDELYTENTFSIILERSIKKDLKFQEYYNLIDESIKLYLKNQFSGAISILLPCIEGILRKITNSFLGLDHFYREGSYLDKTKDVVLKKWGNIIFSEDKVWFHPKLKENNEYLYYFDEVPIIVNGFFKYLKAFFYRDIDEFKKEYPNENLNRHSIMHGYTSDYGKKENYLLLFGMLDFLLLLGNFELMRSPHNYESYIKMIEYRNLKNPTISLDFRLNHKEILIKSLKLIKKIIKESLDGLYNEILKNTWKKDYMNEIFKDELSKRIKEIYFIPFFAYSLVYNHTKKSIVLKYGYKGVNCSSDEYELNIFEIYFTEKLKKENAYMYFYINLETKEIKVDLNKNIYL